MANSTADHEVKTFEVEEEAVGQRLDVYVARVMPQFSRAKVQKMVEQEAITVNGKICKSKEPLKAKDAIKVTFVRTIPNFLEPVAMPLDILYEDEHLIVVNKAAGILVHAGAGEHGATLVQGLLHHVKKLSKSNDHVRAGIVHRLDKETSGALVAAKDDFVHEALSKQFQEKTNLREYIALLDGYMENAYLCRESYLRRDPLARTKFSSMELEEFKEKYGGDEFKPEGLKFAKSHFFKLKTYAERLTLAKIQLETGRTHQIRVHARDLKLPVVGDPVYHTGTQLPEKFPKAIIDRVFYLKRQMLHARVLGFEHPILKKKLAFEAPVPKDMQEILDALAPFGK